MRHSLFILFFIPQEGTTLAINLTNDTHSPASIVVQCSKAFKKLYPGYHNQVQATMTLSLVK